MSGRGQEPSLAARWGALHEAAQVVALLAGAASPGAGEGGNLADAAARLPASRRRLVEQGIEDLGVIMEHGISALLAAHARDAAAAVAPARSLWEEFLIARSGILALCPPGELERRRLG